LKNALAAFSGVKTASEICHHPRAANALESRPSAAMVNSDSLFLRLSRYHSGVTRKSPCQPVTRIDEMALSSRGSYKNGASAQTARP
jgi:hypothetical protein